MSPTSGILRAVGLLVVVCTLALAAWFSISAVHRAQPPRADDGASNGDRADGAPTPTPSEAQTVTTRRIVHPKPRTPSAAESSTPAFADHQDPAREHGEQEEIGAAEYIEALRASGETGGLAAFPPPGTRPPQSGIIVPDDYELPEGYVRHYQTTDDGRRLEAILTLSPDYELVDEHGSPIRLGPDRIVPAELAPPDLPVRVLEVPPQSSPPGSGR